MTRGILYMIWGTEIEHVLQRSIASVRAIHPELPMEVVRLPAADRFLGLAQKTTMLERSPFDETLYLDVDTVVLDRLDYGFEKAAQFGLACCINECPWASRHLGLGDKPNLIEYNTGVMFFTAKARPVFEAWTRLSKEIDSSIFFMRNGRQMRMPYADQCGFAAAIEEIGVSPFVLPLNWNLRGEFIDSFFGPIKIWHAYDEVPAEFADLAEKYRGGEMLIEQHVIRRR